MKRLLLVGMLVLAASPAHAEPPCRSGLCVRLRQCLTPWWGRPCWCPDDYQRRCCPIWTGIGDGPWYRCCPCGDGMATGRYGGPERMNPTLQPSQEPGPATMAPSEK
jgi:hypothetical protein